MAKYIKCPECGHVFKRPLVDEKRIGFGFNPPGLGVIHCPECKVEKRRKYFTIVPESEVNAQPAQTKEHTVKQPSEKEQIEASKFEDE